MDVQDITTVLVFLVTFLLAYLATRRRRGVPPGPPLFPIVGNLPQLASRDVLGRLNGFRKTYGDIFALYVGSELTIFLNGYDALYKTLVKNGTLFNARPRSGFDALVVKNPGIIMAHDQLWKEQRQFIQAAIHRVCMNNSGEALENLVHREVDALVEEIGEIDGQFDIKDFINVAIANVTCTFLYGTRFNFGDSGILRAMSTLRDSTEDTMTVTTLCNCFPALGKLPFDIVGAKKIIVRYHKVVDYLRQFLPKSEEEETKGEPTVANMYLDKVVECVRDGRKNTFTHQQMEITLFDMFGAGTETSANTIRWGLLYLTQNLDVQERMFHEISGVLGNKQPSYAVRNQLPYSHAVQLEVLRCRTVAPLGVPHSVRRDAIIDGFLFPENCTVMTNLHSVNVDSNLWQDPDLFHPERFLNEALDEVIVPKHFIPFSVGPRSCLGETIARVEIFIFLVTLVQHFKILPVKEGFSPDMNGSLGLTWAPENFKIIIEKRKH
ncbi:vitamin D 25-hydroxylase-like [Mya arenaria]|uniref:vitamin D 25-hydroxylase-like n=1 Tax=Mya arenaria TaxID=6604 RepID=UPI0022E75062|nr:vitamin D 25-hydroxylase-like [Mya arenaria]